MPPGRADWIALVLITLGVGGTIAVVAAAAAAFPVRRLVWTFLLFRCCPATFYLNLQEQLGLRRTLLLLAMRIVALALLVPMLFEPVLHYLSRPKPQRPLIFLIDTSGSMSVPGHPERPDAHSIRLANPPPATAARSMTISSRDTSPSPRALSDWPSRRIWPHGGRRQEPQTSCKAIAKGLAGLAAATTPC